METRFIPGTNEQYSIREDGMVIIHYKWTKNFKSTYIVNRLLKPRKGRNLSLYIKINGKDTSRSANSLLRDIFGFAICNRCKNKFTPNKSPEKCDSCKKELACQATKNWTINHPEKHQDRQMNRIINPSRTYVSHLLGLKTSQLTDELYELHKKTLLLKREICQKEQKT